MKSSERPRDKALRRPMRLKLAVALIRLKIATKLKLARFWIFAIEFYLLYHSLHDLFHYLIHCQCLQLRLLDNLNLSQSRIE